jgi:hypothetical protein
MNCLLNPVTGGNIEEMKIPGRRRKQMLNGLEEKRRYCNFKEAKLALALVKKSFRKRLWTSRETDYVINPSTPNDVAQ